MLNNLLALFSDLAVQNCFLVGGGALYFCICTYEPYQFTNVCIFNHKGWMVCVFNAI